MEWYMSPISYLLVQASTDDRCDLGSTTANVMGPTPKSSSACISVEIAAPIRRDLALLSTVAMDIVMCLSAIFYIISIANPFG